MEQALISSRKRNVNVDILRGIAALLVVTTHIISSVPDISEKLYIFQRIITHIHVPLFFLMSGFCSKDALQRGSIWQFIGSKAFRLLVPYIMWSTVAVTAKHIGAIISGSFQLSEFVNEWIDTVLYAKSLWFLIAMFWVLILARLIYPLFKSKKRWIIMIVLVLICLPPLKIELLAVYKVPSMFFLFLAGLVIHEKYELLIKTIEKYSTLLIVVALALLIAAPFYCTYTGFEGVWFLDTFYVVVTCLAAMSFVILLFLPLIRKWNIPKKLFSSLGEYSLEIYVIHMLFVKYLVLATPVVIMQIFVLFSTLYFLIYALGICIICYLVSRFLLNHIPIYNFLMRGIVTAFRKKVRQS